MKNIIQVALIGGAAYLAIDYMKKRKANQNKAGAIIAAANNNVLAAAEMQEEGEEGIAFDVAQNQQLGAAESQENDFSFASGSHHRSFYRVDGWEDSTPISFGM